MLISNYRDLSDLFGVSIIFFVQMNILENDISIEKTHYNMFSEYSQKC